MELQGLRSGWVAGALALVLWSVNGPVAAQALDGSVMDPAVRQELNVLTSSANYGAFLHFSAGTPRAEQDRLLTQLGLTIKADFRRYTSAIFAEGPAAAFLSAATVPGITYVEHNAPLRYFGETQPWATRVRVAQEPVSGGPYYADAEKTQILDGSGVTLGVIDSGMLGAHPDFADNLLYNYKVVSVTTDSSLNYVDVGKTDSESQVGGHGTHVTGTVGGGGQASNGGYPTGAVAPNIPGTFTGAAPGAQLIHWGNGLGILVLNPALAYQHLLDNFDAGTAGFDTLVAVNNSYGSLDPAPYNPNSVASQLIKQIVDRGIVMAFAAGNDGGDGTQATTSTQCRDPNPGVICVASYNDNGTGARDAELSTFSSRGQRSDSSTASFPDIATPGDTITSTCIEGLPNQSICTGTGETQWAPFYGTISGTSMSTPHVVGIIGLIQQAYKGKHGKFMTPAEVEEIIQRTATRLGNLNEYVADPQARNAFAGVGHTQTHFAWGAGLVDVPSILDALGINKAGSGSAGAPFVVFDGDVDSGTASDVVALTMQDRTVDGVEGIDHIIRLADGGTLVSGTRYTIERNVAGKAHTTTVEVDAGGNKVVAASDDEDNSAPASLVQLIGNDLHVFVSSGAMGLPAVGEPVHNIRVVVRDVSGAPLDFAPSPVESVDPEIDALRPMFGRAFTVGILGEAEEVDPLVACEAPGRRILRDARGDIFALNDSVPQNEEVPFYDLRELSIIQPDFEPGADYSITFRLKMEGFPIVPTGTWPINFCSPAFKCVNPDTNTATYGADNKYYTVEMTTDPTKGASPAAPAFLVREPTATEITVGSRTVAPARSGSVAPDGTILIEVFASDIGLTPGGAGTEVLSKFQSRVTPAATTPDNMPDGLAGEGEYRTLAPGACSTSSDNTAPVAENSSATVAQDTATEITLVASDADGDSLTYSIVSGPTNGSLGTISGNRVTYSPAAGYSGSDSFTFKANDGQADSAPATVSITVGEATGPVLDARLVATNNGQPIDPDRTYDAPLAVRLDAGSSTAPSGRQIASVTFHLGDNSTVTQDCATVETCLVFNTTYEFAGSYQPFVVITDSSSQRDTSESLLIKTRVTVTAEPADPEDPDTTRTVAQLILRDADGKESTAIRGQVPLTVTMDGSNSVAANGRQITSYRFDFDDGTVMNITEPTATHVYQTPGAYEPTLTITDSTGATSTSKAAVAVNPAGSGGGTTVGDGGGSGGGNTSGGGAGSGGGSTDGGNNGGGVVPTPNDPSPPTFVIQQEGGGGAMGSLALLILSGGLLLRRRRTLAA